MSSFIKGLGHYLPTKTILNSDLEKLVDTSDQWILERTGIKQRHIADPEQFATDLAFEAAKKALEMAGVSADSVQAIIFATVTPDAVMPQASCILQRKLGAHKAFAFDIGAACSGFVYALSVADGLMTSQNLDNVLVIGAETLSRITDYRDRETCILFGDGAGAVLLGRRNESSTKFASHLASNGNLGDLLTMKNPRPHSPFDRTQSHETAYIEMRGREVFKHAVRMLSESSQIVVEKAGLQISDIDWFIPHQANQRIMEAVADTLGLRSDQIANNIATTGNTSSASIPLALSQYVESGKIRRGDKVLMAAFGAGITYGAAVLEY